MASLGFTRTAAVVATVTAMLAGAASAQPGPVQGQPLEALDLWSAAGRDTGLSRDLWQGTHASLAEAVMGGLGQRPLTPAEAALARRILAAGARAPEEAGPALAAQRVRALLALGDLAAAEAILSRTPRIEASEALSRAQAEAALWRGQDARACETAQSLQAGREAPWQLKLRAFCALVASQAAAAEVTFGLWRQSGDADPAFARLFGQALAGGDGDGEARLDDALAWALSRRLELSPPEDLTGAHPAAVAVLAGDSAAPRPLRVAAMAAALRLGLATPSEARMVYAPAERLGAPAATEAAAPPPPEPDVAGLAARPGPLAEADLFLLARAAGDPAVRQAAVLALLARAEGVADRRALAALAAEEVGRLQAADAVGEDPARLAVAAALAGDPAAAWPLLALAPRSASGADGLRFTLAEAVLAAADPARGGPTLDRLVELGARGGQDERLRAQSAALLLSALGVEMSAQARARFAAFDVPRPRTTPARLTALDMAGAAGRQGEAALYALSIVAQQPQGLAVADRAAIVRALARAGLVEDARAFAFEGLLALQAPA